MKAVSATQALPELTSEEITLLESTLVTGFPEGFTLIFPWGSSLLSHKRSLNYLRYCLALPDQAMQLAILRLLGLRPYRRRWWTLNSERRHRYLKTHPVAYMRRIARRRTGMKSTDNTKY